MLKINIENFQSIHSASFSINGFTVLVGENDIGKSSSFRAIHSLFNNRSGDAFITLNKPYSRVSCSFEDKCITWSKHRKTGASYTLSIGDKSQDYDKVGRNTPDFIPELGFGEISLKSGKIDPHFSRQREEPFLVSSAGSKQILTEFFSELLKFGTLGKAIIQVSKDTRKLNTDINVLEKQKELQETILSSFPNPEELKLAFQDLESTQHQLYSFAHKLSLINEYTSIPFYPHPLPSLSIDFESSLREIKNNLAAHEKLVSFMEMPKIDYAIGDIPDYESQIEYLEFITLCSYFVYADIPDYSDTGIRHLELLRKCMDVRDVESAIEEIDKRLKKAEEEFLSALEEYGVCPLCERPSGNGRHSI